MACLKTDKVDEESMSIDELWKALDFFVQRRIKDNDIYDHCYPINTRTSQMFTLRSLVEAIDRFHAKFKEKE